MWTVGVGFTGLAAPVAGFMVGDQPVFGVAGIALVVAAGFGLAGARHPDGDHRRAPPAAVATAALVLLASLAALGDDFGIAWALGFAYVGAFALWLVIYLNSAGDRSTEVGLDGAEHTRDALVRLGRIFSHLGPPIYMFLVLVGVAGTRLWLADQVGDLWAWSGGLAGMVGLVGLAVVEFSRRHLDKSTFANLLAGILALVGIVVGLGDALAVAAASAVSAAVFWRIPDDSRTRHILGYASYLAGYCRLVVASIGEFDATEAPTASLIYLPFLAPRGAAPLAT